MHFDEILTSAPALLSSDAPEALQAAGLRLLSRLWQVCGARAYPPLRAAVIGKGLVRKQLPWLALACLTCCFALGCGP